MAQLKNTMDIFKLLDQSNCRECGEPTCMAFAGAVFTGKRSLAECTHLERQVVAAYDEKPEKRSSIEQDMQGVVEQLQRKIVEIDLDAVARRLKVPLKNGKLTLKTLGKDFSVDERGNLYSDIHIHPWIAIPVLNYIIAGGRVPVSGKWVPLRELKSGKNWYRLFEQRCEKPFKKVADTYTDLFEDLIHIFNGRQVENHYESDISLVLHPLPLVPLLVCYWKPEDGLASDLHLFFDITAEDNLNIESIYSLVAGLVRMFEKLAMRHGFNG